MSIIIKSKNGQTVPLKDNSLTKIKSPNANLKSSANSCPKAITSVTKLNRLPYHITRNVNRWWQSEQTTYYLVTAIIYGNILGYFYRKRFNFIKKKVIKGIKCIRRKFRIFYKGPLLTPYSKVKIVKIMLILWRGKKRRNK